MPMIRRTEDAMLTQPVALRDEMNRLFESILQGSPSRRELTWDRAFAPAIDIHETATDVVVTAEIPGINPADVQIDLTGNVLTLKGEKKEESEEKGKNWHRIERGYGSFTRSFQLPESVDPEKTRASCDNGVLTVTIGKTEAARPRSIKVDIKK